MLGCVREAVKVFECEELRVVRRGRSTRCRATEGRGTSVDANRAGWRVDAESELESNSNSKEDELPPDREALEGLGEMG